MKRFVKMTWAVLFMLMTAVACSDDMNQNQQASVYDALKADSEYSTLVSLIDEAGLTETLEGSGTFTIFAPTNDAFAALPANYQDNLSVDLPQLLSYHVLGFEVNAAEAIATAQSDNPIVETSESSELVLYFDPSASAENEPVLVLNGHVQVITPDDALTDNGIVHKVDAVLFPGKNFPGNLVEVLSASPRFATLLGEVSDIPGLPEALSGVGPFTLFAPTNVGFMQLPSDLVPSLTEEQLEAVLQYHVLGQAVDEADARAIAGAEPEAPTPVPTLLDEQDIFVAVDPIQSLFINVGSEVTATDITVTNGVMHVLDSVLVPVGILPNGAFPGSTVGALSSYPRFSSLVGAVVAADLVEALTDKTVFAPTNLAFESAEIPADISIEDLTNVLLYHVLDTPLLVEELSNPQPTLLTDASIEVLVSVDSVLLNDAINVIEPDILTNDGIIQVIDGVLEPPPAP